MNPAVLLQLIVEQYERILRLQAENAQLRTQLAAATAVPPAPDPPLPPETPAP